MTLSRRRRLAAVLTVSTLGVAGCAYSDTQSDELACAWNGGPLDNSSFRGYQEPGSGKKNNGLNSSVRYFPTNIRNYKVSLDPNESDSGQPDSIRASVDGVNMGFEPKVYFFFNGAIDLTEPDKDMPLACLWWETSGKRFDADDFDSEEPDANWRTKYLPQQFRPALNEVVTTLAQELAGKVPEGLPKALYLNENVDLDGNGPDAPVPARTWFADEIGRRMPDALARLLGRQFFCGKWVPPSATVRPSDANPEPDQPGCEPFVVLLDKQPVIDNQDLANSFSAAQNAAAVRSAAVAKATEEAQQASEVAKLGADQAQAQASEAERRSEADRRRSAAEAASAAANVAKAYAEAQAAMAHCLAVGAQGNDCALLIAAEKGNFPTVIMGGDGQPLVQVPAP